MKEYEAVSYLLSCTAKIPKIKGVANKNLFCNATPLCAFYAAVFWVDADFLDITYSFVCSCLEYFEIAFTLPKSLYACILWIEVSVMFGPIFTFFDGCEVNYWWILTTFWVQLDRWCKSVRKPWTTFAKTRNFSLFEFKDIKSLQKIAHDKGAFTNYVCIFWPHTSLVCTF